MRNPNRISGFLDCILPFEGRILTSDIIHEVIKNTARSFEGTCKQKRISIELLFASKVLLVHADKRKITQVLYNLLDNAIAHSRSLPLLEGLESVSSLGHCG